MNEQENQLKEINPNYKIIHRFMGGMSNFTYLIEDFKNNKKFVYRYPGKGNYNFVNYDDEKLHLKEIEKLNISNETIYLNTKKGIKIATYIEGDNIKSDVNLDSISIILKKLHNSNVKFKKYDHLKRLEKYESLHNNKVDEYFDLKSKWEEIYNNHLKEHIKYPSHNDAQFANFIQTKEKQIYLLDWEYAGINDYIYDIACFGNVDFEMAEKLLNNYEDEVDDKKIIRLYAWRMFQCLQWFNVASYKEQIGLSKDLDVDFKKVSENYIILANKFLQDINSI